MVISSDPLIKQRSVIEFLAAERCSTANFHARMETAYVVVCISDSAFLKWVRTLKVEDQRKTRHLCVIESIWVGPFQHRTRMSTESWLQIEGSNKNKIADKVGILN